MHDEYMAVNEAQDQRVGSGDDFAGNEDVQYLISHSKKLSIENEMLKVQVSNFRSEIIRLQSEIDDVKASALRAVDSLRAFSGDLKTDGRLIDRLDVASSSRNYSSLEQQSPLKANAKSPKSASPLRLQTQSQSPIPTGASRRISMKVRDLERTATESAAEKISPVVEERLLYAVFDKYKAEASGFMPLSRCVHCVCGRNIIRLIFNLFRNSYTSACFSVFCSSD